MSSLNFDSYHTMSELSDSVVGDEPKAGAESSDASNKQHKKKVGNERIYAALISAASRILAQIVGSVAGVLLGIAMIGKFNSPDNGVPTAKSKLGTSSPFHLSTARQSEIESDHDTHYRVLEFADASRLLLLRDSTSDEYRVLVIPEEDKP